MIGGELDRRFGGSARIHYRNVQDMSVRSEHARVIEEIETRGLPYPVTVIGGVPVYDGAVSYPGIMRAVQERLECPSA